MEELNLLQMMKEDSDWEDFSLEELEEILNTKIILTNGNGGQLLRDILGVK